jgi:hypothetical protein
MSERRLREALARDRVRALQNLPFTVIKEHGMVHVDAKIDATFKKALRDGVPTPLRAKMNEALSSIPPANARDHSVRYFGGPQAVSNMLNVIGPLLIELNRYLTESRSLPGIFDWLEVTGLGNDYRMLKVLLAWAEMGAGPNLGHVPTQAPRSPTYG